MDERREIERWRDREIETREGMEWRGEERRVCIVLSSIAGGAS